MYMDHPVSMPQSPEINYHLFTFVQIQVKVHLITPFFEVIKGCTVTILCSQERK